MNTATLVHDNPPDGFTDSTPFVIIGDKVHHDPAADTFWRAAGALDTARAAASWEAHYIARQAVEYRRLPEPEWIADYRQAMATEAYAKAVYEAEVGR